MTDKKDDGKKDHVVVFNLDAAVLQALASASQAEVAQADLHAEVTALAAAIAHATQDQLTATIHSGKRQTPLGALATFTVTAEHSDPEDTPPESQSVLIVAKREGRVPWEQTREVCRIIQAAGGYPFRIEGPEATSFAEDKDGLHAAFYEVSRHPRTGLKIKGLLQQLKSGASEGASG